MVQKLVHSTLSFFLLVAVLYSLFGMILPTTGYPQELPSLSRKTLRLHPDGAVGKMSLSASMVYSSASAERPFPAKDFQSASFGLSIVPTWFLTLQSAINIKREDSIRYQPQARLRIYLKNPLTNRAHANPDGPVGGPVLTGSGGVRFYGDADGYTSWVGNMGVAVSVSTYLTLETGYHFYEDRQLFDLVTVYGGVSIYTTHYAHDSTYTNPDGIIGSMAVRVRGGGSAYGGMGQMELVFPLQTSLTLTALFRYERTKAPVRKALSAGVAIAYYAKR